MKYMSVAVSAALIATPVAARDKLYALPSEGATASYERGIATVQIIRSNGIVQLTPLGLDHGGMTFLVTVFNNTDRPINFDLSNIRASASGQAVRAIGVDELVRKAKNRAFWKSVGIGLLGGLAAGAASSRTNTFYSSYTSRYGTSFAMVRYPSFAGQLEADRITGTTVYALAAIEGQLARTREMLSDQIVQTTTLQPGDSYAGRVVLSKISGPLPRNVEINLDWNGESYPFALRLQGDGATPPPAIESLTLRQTFVPSPTGSAGSNAVALASYSTLPKGAIPINRGYLRPAKTASGYCIVAPPDYRGAGTSDSPAVTSGKPRCAMSN
jgi:hypothetical protein